MSAVRGVNVHRELAAHPPATGPPFARAGARGDPRLDISAQAAVLRLAEAASIGVQAFSGHLLQPLKSATVMLGVGKNLQAVTWSRFDTCPSRTKCTFGRTPRAAEQVQA